MRGALLRALAWAVTLAVLGAAGACAPSLGQRAKDGIVSSGSTIAELSRANDAVYVRETQPFIDAKMSLPAYDAAVAPMNAEYTARVHAIAEASNALYAVARALDATQDPNSEAVRSAALDAAHALELAVDVLRDSVALDPVPIPPRARAEIDRLRALAAGVIVTDAGLELPNG